jgi:ATPase subunit of ABC transporter with duplicated ATPase domains
LTTSITFTGDNESGKTTLIAKLQGVEEPKKGAGLEYYYIDVRDEYRDGRYSVIKFFCLLYNKQLFQMFREFTVFFLFIFILKKQPL